MFQDVALTYKEYYNFSVKLPSKRCWKCYFHLGWKGYVRLKEAIARKTRLSLGWVLFGVEGAFLSDWRCCQSLHFTYERDARVLDSVCDVCKCI